MTLSIFDLELPDPDDVDNIIFVRIPKTGSSAVMTLCPWHRNCEDNQTPGVITYPPWWRGSEAHICHKTWKHVKTEKTFSFTVVRNPFDYLASRFYSQLRSSKLNVSEASTFLLFENYINFYCKEDIELPDNDNFILYLARSSRLAKGSVHKIARNQYMAKSLFYQAFDRSGKCQVDVIVRYEKLNEGMSEIFCKFFKNSSPIILPHVRVEKRNKNYKTLYTSEMIRTVEEYYKNDLKMFRYSFDGPTDDETIIDPKKVSIFPYGMHMVELNSRRFVEEPHFADIERSWIGVVERNKKLKDIENEVFSQYLKIESLKKEKRKILGANSPIAKKVKKLTPSNKQKRSAKKVNGSKSRPKKTARYRTVNGRKIKV